MQRLGLILLALLLFATPALATTAAGTLTANFDLSAQAAGQEVRLWLPYPVSDADQAISNVRIGGDYAEAGVYTDRTYGTPMFYARWAADAKSRVLTFSFDVVRNEVQVRDLSTPETPWDPSDYARFLAPTMLGPTDGQIKKIADEITKGETTVLGKTFAVYNWIVENMYRDPETRGCGSGDVCALLLRPGGKCADISSVFIALARAAGVPCREVFGIRLGKAPVVDVSTWQHCWAEFYLPGTGWVPVDPADVRKAMLVQKLGLKDPKVAELRSYFWGGIDPYRVRLSEGRDLLLAPPQAGAPLNYLMYPYAEVGGQVIDWLDPATFKYSITYRQ